MLTSYATQLKDKGEIYLRIKARPGAASTDVRGIMKSDDGETVKIDIAAAPERGQANQELIKYLAMWFGVGKDNVKIVSGAGEKIKLIKISKS
jgi:uncharacterized protein